MFTYPNWVLRLIRLASRAQAIGTAIPNESGPQVRGPVFEHACTAPEDLLRWMIQHPERLDWSDLESDSEATREQRRKLRDGDPETRQLAQDQLTTSGCRGGRGQWHVLEGTTYVECGLFFDRVTVFVETVREPAKRVSWLRERDAVIRSLDCLRVEPARADSWFVVVVGEAADASRLDGGPQFIRGSLPHLSDDEVDGLYRHYAGFTTWTAIERAFNLDAP